MRKVVTGILIILLVACLAVMGVCIAFVANGGENPFKQSIEDDKQVEDNISKSVAVVTTANSFEVTSSDNAVTYGYIGGVQFNLSNDGSVINISGAFAGEEAYLEVSINSSKSYSVGSSLYSNVVFDDFYECMSFGTINLTDLISAGTLLYDTQYYLFARDTVSGTWVSIMDFIVVSVSTDLPETPTKTGYTFTGWYTDEDCTQLYEEDYVTEDITLYAGWRANTYSIVFNPNGASGNAIKQNFTYDTPQNLQNVAFSRDYYKLVGWATSEDGEVVFDLGESVSNLSSTDGDIIQLYAVWERVTCLVTFVVDGKTYARVEVDAGTNLADIINNSVVSAFFFVSDEDLASLPTSINNDVTINLQKTDLGNIVMQDWVLYTLIGVCSLFVVGIIASLVSKRKGGV